MSDGLKIEYTEGIMTATLEIRSNLPSDNALTIMNFIKFCERVWENEANKTPMTPVEDGR